MKRLYFPIMTLAALALAGNMNAQNFNPTVEVTNTYEGKLMEVHKPEIAMNVPDSLLALNLDFDYSVFESPYKGAYEFKPYAMNMKPQRDAYTGKTLFLRAGAGYSFHPDLEVVYSPQLPGRFQMSLYGEHQSYFGNYRNVFAAHPKSGSSIYSLVRDNDSYSGVSPYKSFHDGMDMQNRFGFEGRVDFDKAMLSFGVGFDGIATRDTILDRSNNAVVLNARVKSHQDDRLYFYYDAAISYRYANDGLDYKVDEGLGTDRLNLHSSLFGFDGSFGPVIADDHKILVDVDVKVADYGGMLDSHVGLMALTPRYVFDHERWRLSLGARLGTFINGDDTPGHADATVMHRKSSQKLYPAVNVGFEAIRDRMLIYTSVTGHGEINPYSSILEANHHFDPSFGRGNGPLMDNSIERINFALGVKGNVATRLRYDFKAGYAIMDNGLLDGISFIDPDIDRARPAVAYMDYKMVYTDLLMSWQSSCLDASGHLSYMHTDILDQGAPVFTPSSFSGNLKAMYNWNKRIYGGIACDFASMRKARFADGTYNVRVPGFVDVTLLGQYKLNRKLEVWGQIGNLLNMNIQRSPFYTESGIYATVGICLNL